METDTVRNTVVNTSPLEQASHAAELELQHLAASQDRRALPNGIAATPELVLEHGPYTFTLTNSAGVCRIEMRDKQQPELPSAQWGLLSDGLAPVGQLERFGDLRLYVYRANRLLTIDLFEAGNGPLSWTAAWGKRMLIDPLFGLHSSRDTHISFALDKDSNRVSVLRRDEFPCCLYFNGKPPEPEQEPR